MPPSIPACRPPSATTVPILDLHPPADDLRAQVLHGLSQEVPTLPCKLFYDEAGSRLFDKITDLPEYYATRTEIGILRRCRDELADTLGGGEVALIEYGSGNDRKVRLLLETLEVAVYVPIDISRWYLRTSAARLAETDPGLPVRPVLADYTRPMRLPTEAAGGVRRLGFFPGGTIGNFTPTQAVDFLRSAASTLGRGQYLMVGADFKKDPALLHAAYNDEQGVTADFNLNLLRRLNDELDADFDLDAWRHYAPYVPAAGRIEMHLVARRDQRVTVAGRRFDFVRGESIHTESSHKYTQRQVSDLAEAGGFRLVRTWSDPDRLFGVHLLQVAGRTPAN